MRKQFTVKERNQWEGETFNYVVDLTEDEAKEVAEKCKQFGNGTLSIKQTDYSDEEIKKMNDASLNCYMDFIARYELKDLKTWSEFGDCFYKGVGLDKK
ncbi:MAG: hypothetical protein R3243_14795 [Arenibacter latericius]|nr:hypothetical protein [Arenibacter latericius]